MPQFTAAVPACVASLGPLLDISLRSAEGEEALLANCNVINSKKKKENAKQRKNFNKSVHFLGWDGIFFAGKATDVAALPPVAVQRLWINHKQRGGKMR